VPCRLLDDHVMRGSCRPGRRNFPDEQPRHPRSTSFFQKAASCAVGPPSSGGQTWSGSCRPEALGRVPKHLLFFKNPKSNLRASVLSMELRLETVRSMFQVPLRVSSVQARECREVCHSEPLFHPERSRGTPDFFDARRCTLTADRVMSLAGAFRSLRGWGASAGFQKDRVPRLRSG